MFKELMKSMRTMSHKIENITEGEQLFLKKNQIISELKSIINEVKNILEWLSSRFEQAKERISEFKDISIEIMYSEKQKKRRK